MCDIVKKLRTEQAEELDMMPMGYAAPSSKNFKSPEPVLEDATFKNGVPHGISQQKYKGCYVFIMDLQQSTINCRGHQKMEATSMNMPDDLEAKDSKTDEYK